MASRVDNAKLFMRAVGLGVAMWPFMTNTTCLDDGLSAFLRVRPRLFSIAYRMLRSAGDGWSRGLLTALGPGFSAGFVVLQR